MAWQGEEKEEWKSENQGQGGGVGTMWPSTVSSKDEAGARCPDPLLAQSVLIAR